MPLEGMCLFQKYVTSNTEQYTESGNMMHLALAYAQLTGDNSMFERYPQLFRTWAELLEQTSLIPSNQLSTE